MAIPTAAATAYEPFIIDGYLEKIARHSSQMLIFEIGHQFPLPHRRLLAGDVLIVEKCGGCDLCRPDDRILIVHNQRHQIKRKKELTAILRRAQLRSVDGGANPITVVGRVLAWINSAEIDC